MQKILILREIQKKLKNEVKNVKKYQKCEKYRKID